MSPDAHIAALARLYGPSAEELRLSLPEHAQGIHAQLIELHARPSVERADTAARNLDAMAAHVRRYRERLVTEGEGRRSQEHG